MRPIRIRSIWMLWIASLHTSRAIQPRQLSIQENTVLNSEDSWIVTLLDVKIRVGHQLGGCLHLLADPFPGLLKDRKPWLHQPWMQSISQVQRLQKKLCGFATLLTTFASRESISIQFHYTLTITQP